MNTTINILWTGGWASTFRVAYAALVGKRVVIPHYIVDLDRHSTMHEMRAIANAREALAQLDEGAAERVGALAITPITEISLDVTVTRAYWQVAKVEALDEQYDWLARYAKSRGLKRLELCSSLHDSVGHILRGRVERLPMGGCRLREGYCWPYSELFPWFHFPVLALSRWQMRSLAERHGFLSVLEHSWFCSRPCNGEPCGTCDACRLTADEGLSYRLSTETLLCHRFRHTDPVTTEVAGCRRQLPMR
ncbi:hypothetical protein [Halomonas sp. BM-2019]|uniref:hypothetical protein n=1 Tax=Halomonas sp. BM-2019 TaxID=2811227 RepID=UPI001B3C45DF|nr:MAG: hypothetical protein J5F18_13125 [Halomonas sp. BM-2019]